MRRSCSSLVTGWFLYNTVVKDTRNAVIGIVLLLVSLPFYAYWARRRKHLRKPRLTLGPASFNNERLSLSRTHVQGGHDFDKAHSSFSYRRRWPL